MSQKKRHLVHIRRENIITIVDQNLTEKGKKKYKNGIFVAPTLIEGCVSLILEHTANTKTDTQAAQTLLVFPRKKNQNINHWLCSSVM